MAGMEGFRLMPAFRTLMVLYLAVDGGFPIVNTAMSLRGGDRLQLGWMATADICRGSAGTSE